MKANYLIEAGRLETKDIEYPELEDNKVIIKVKSVGLCGSDMHYYEYGKIDKFVVEEPLILGHEASGEIVEVGNNVEGFKKGDRVTIEPGVPCGECEYCRTGEYNLCQDMVFMATPPIHGAFQEFILYDPNYIYKIPDNISYEEAALIEPLAIGLNIYQKSDFEITDKILILGSGTVGQMALQVFKASGASEVVMTDINKLPLEIAKKSGADKVLDSNSLESLKDNYFDIVIDAVGVQETLFQTTQFVKPGGNIVLVGMSPESILKYEIGKILNKELTIRGIFRYANLYKKGIELIKNEKVNFEKLITHRYKFEELTEAFDYLSENQDKYLKPMINF